MTANSMTSWSRLSLCVLLWPCLLCAQGSASPIAFEASPMNVTNGLTEILNLRCSLNNNGLVLSTEADQQVDRVVSIVVSKATTNGSTELASVTSFDRPVLYSKEEGLTVKGGLSSCNTSVPQEEAFLELTWSYPSTDDSGTYQCEMSTLSPSHHQTTHYSSLEVKVRKPSLEQLVEDLVSVKMASSRLQTKVFKLQEQLQNTEAQLVQVTQQPRMRSESGSVELRRQTGRFMPKLEGRITFKQPFQHVPHTLVSIISLYASKVQPMDEIRVTNKSVTGFNVHTMPSSGALPTRLMLAWLSIGI